MCWLTATTAPPADPLVLQVVYELAQLSEIGLGESECQVGVLGQPAFQPRLAGVLAQAARQLIPGEVGRREVPREIPPGLPALAHSEKLLLQIIGFRLNLALPVQDQHTFWLKIIQQVIAIQQPVVEGQGFYVGGGKQLGQLFVEALSGVSRAAGKVHCSHALFDGRPVRQFGQLLPGWNNVDGLDVAMPLLPGRKRPLAVGIEQADSVHLIVPQFQPEGVLSLGREYIDDAAAQAEGAGAFNYRFVPVTEINPGVQKAFRTGDPLAQLDSRWRIQSPFGALKHRRRQRVAQGRRHRGNYDWSGEIALMP